MVAGSTWPFICERSTATCRFSSSVLVMMSPFTFTSTCSRISRGAPDRGRQRQCGAGIDRAAKSFFIVVSKLL